MGLTGGIGAGKSAVAARLREHGAVHIDADQLARDVVDPGTSGLAAVTVAFGPAVLTADGQLDRAALGARVFADQVARRDLEAIIHPLVRTRAAELIAAAPPDAVVVNDIPLLVETGQAADFALVAVVETPVEVRVNRLVASRGLTADQVRERIGAQATDAQRRAAADALLDNAGTVDQLLAQVDRLWADRLVPFEQRLRQGSTAVTGRPIGAAAAARIGARLVRVLAGARLSEALVLQVPRWDLVEASVGQLRERGFLLDQRQRIIAVDPGQSATVRVVVGD